MKFTLGIYAALSLGLVIGCNPKGATDAAESKDESATAPDKTKAEADKPAPLGTSGDKANEDSPDAQFYAEQYVIDGLETDDPEAFQGASLALADTAADPVDAADDPAPVDAPVATTSDPDSNQKEPAIPPPSDADPTEGVDDLVDHIVAKIMYTADADADGLLTKDEFGQARYSKLEIPEDAWARIEARRGELFDKFAGADASMSVDELKEALASLKEPVKKLRIARYLPYAEHLAKAWKGSKAEFDKDGDGKLNEDELKGLRDARGEQKDALSAKLLAGSYVLCHKLLESGKQLPPWIAEQQTDLGKQVKEKKSFLEEFGDKFKPKKPGPNTAANLLPSSQQPPNGGSGTGSGSGGGSGSTPTSNQEEPDSGSGSDGSDADGCTGFLDSAAAFNPNVSNKVFEDLKARGILE